LEEEMDAVAVELKVKLEELSAAFEATATEIGCKARELKDAGNEQHQVIQKEIKELRASLKITWNEWILLTKQVARDYQLAH
jgi:hypothetical protein